MSSQMDSDYLLARRLEEQFAMEDAHEEVVSFIPAEFQKGSPFKTARPSASKSLEGDKTKGRGASIVAPEWEDLDPTPDLQALFLQYNDRFFWGRLAACEVRWSPRMTLCAGICSYSPRQGYCSIRLSVPLLKLRPRKDFVETLLHEMIHAYLFVTDGNDDHDGHGPAFHKHMHRINKDTGTNISVYHSFHDEVALYKQHWWKCNGPCVKRKPFYGMVKRSMNRAPGPNDLWWKEHEATCGGSYTKVKEPEGYGLKNKKKKVDPAKTNGQKDIRSFGPPKPPSDSRNNGERREGGGGGARGNIYGFGSSSSSGGLKTKGKSGTYVVQPGWRFQDNSSSGHVVGGQASSGGGQSASGGSKTPAVSSVNLSASSEEVRRKVRGVWGGQRSEPVDKEAKENRAAGTGPRSDIQIVNELQACPVCIAKVPSSKMNVHLDECLMMEAFKTKAMTDIPTKSTIVKASKRSGGVKRPNPFVGDDDDFV